MKRTAGISDSPLCKSDMVRVFLIDTGLRTEMRTLCMAVAVYLLCHISFVSHLKANHFKIFVVHIQRCH